MSNDQSPYNKPSRLKMGDGVLTTLLYLWLAARGSGGLDRLFSPSGANGCGGRQCLNGLRGVLQRREFKFR